MGDNLKKRTDDISTNDTKCAPHLGQDHMMLLLFCVDSTHRLMGGGGAYRYSNLSEAGFDVVLVTPDNEQGTC